MIIGIGIPKSQSRIGILVSFAPRYSPSNSAQSDHAGNIVQNGATPPLRMIRAGHALFRSLAIFDTPRLRSSRPSQALSLLFGDLPCSLSSSFAKPAPSLISSLILIAASSLPPVTG